LTKDAAGLVDHEATHAERQSARHAPIEMKAAPNRRLDRLAHGTAELAQAGWQKQMRLRRSHGGPWDLDLVGRIMLRHFTAVLLDFSGPRKFQGARFGAKSGRRGASRPSPRLLPLNEREGAMFIL
jgi:hypothetical protein